VILVTGIGRDLIVGDHVKVIDGEIPTVLAFFGHQHLAGGKFMRTFID
jgi:hypothetical protein